MAPTLRNKMTEKCNVTSIYHADLIFRSVIDYYKDVQYIVSDNMCETHCVFIHHLCNHSTKYTLKCLIIVTHNRTVLSQHVTVRLLIFMCCLIRNFSEVQNPELKGANIHTTLPVFSGDNKNL